VIVKEPTIFKQFDTLTEGILSDFEYVYFFIFPTRISVNEPKFWMISWWLDILDYCLLISYYKEIM